MIVYHALAGDSLEIQEQEFRWKAPRDVVKQRACDQWRLSPDDLIVLVGDGGSLTPREGASSDLAGGESARSSSSVAVPLEVAAPGETSPPLEDAGSRATISEEETEILQTVAQRPRDVFLFLRSALDPEAGAVVDQLVLCGGVTPSAAGEVDRPEDDLLRLGSFCQDPAFQAFRSNIEEAQRRVSGSRPIAALASSLAGRLRVQRLAGRAVLSNLTNHQDACCRSMALFLKKNERVQERLHLDIGSAESSMSLLADVPLHSALRADGCETLADVVPRERIARFAENLEAERARLARRLEKLRQQDARAQALCRQATDRMEQFLEEDAVDGACLSASAEQARAEREMLPALHALVPGEGASPHSVLQEEKRSADALEEISVVCGGVRDTLPELQSCWDQRRASFLQRLREVSFVQSKVRDVERQAALLEEEVNVQRNYSQQLSHLRKMPKAYNRALCEVARRRQFHDRYSAKCESARSALARMMQEENSRRRAFAQRYGCHLPADLVQGLNGLAPAVSVDMPEFDTLLPHIDFPSIGETPAGGSLPRREFAREASTSCSSSVRSLPGGHVSALFRGPAGTTTDNAIGMAASATGLARSATRTARSWSDEGTASALAQSKASASSSGGSEEQRAIGSARRSGAGCSDDLEARNRELEAQISRLAMELARFTGAESGTEGPGISSEVTAATAGTVTSLARRGHGSA